MVCEALHYPTAHQRPVSRTRNLEDCDDTAAGGRCMTSLSKETCWDSENLGYVSSRAVGGTGNEADIEAEAPRLLICLGPDL